MARESTYDVPDFHADEDVRARYRATTRELIAAAVARGLQALREEQAAILADLTAAARDAEREQQRTDREAHLARARYARLVPRQRTASGLVRPPTLFFDDIISVGAASKHYELAVETARASQEAALAARQAFGELEAFRGSTESALRVRELEIRRFFKSDEGRAQLDEDPRVREYVVRCAAIDAERAVYAERLAAGVVTDEERRDRTMAEEGMRFLDGDVRGLQGLRDRDVAFGRLRYFAFRDRTDRIWLIDNVPDLALLLHLHFDVIYTNDRYLVGRAVGDAASQAERTQAKFAGPDPRAGRGVDPRLLRALVEFVTRERATV